MSLNTVVNNLIRAAAGIPSDISDADLDKHVAQLLAEEAKAKERSWGELGLGAFLQGGSCAPDSNTPKPNKRFLASIIRNVDDHNNALLRAQAQAAHSARLGRSGESSNRESRRIFDGALRSIRTPIDRKTSSHMRSPRSQSRRELSEQRHLREKSAERFHDSAPPHRAGRRTHHDSRGHRTQQSERSDSPDGQEWNEDRRYSPRRNIPRSPDQRQRSKPRPHLRLSHSGIADDETTRIARRRHDHPGSSHNGPRPANHSNRASKKHDPASGRSYADGIPPEPDTFRPPSPPLPERISRMDKYFQQSYDPRMDVGEVPKEGIIAAVGWDNMLAVVKSKAEKPRSRSPTLKTPALSDRLPAVEHDRERDERRRKREARAERCGEDDCDEERRLRRARKKEKALAGLGAAQLTRNAGDHTPSHVFYAPKGGLREWDMGK